MSFVTSVSRTTLSTIAVGICLLIPAGCSSSKAAPATPPAVVEVATVVQQDTPIYSEWGYKGGATSYLEVLDSETRYFSAQLSLAQSQLQELESLVQIYRSLGGGWQQ
jgi:hypothetical protein